MSKLPKRLRDKEFARLVTRQGETCAICGGYFPSGTPYGGRNLVVDHGSRDRPCPWPPLPSLQHGAGQSRLGLLPG